MVRSWNKLKVGLAPIVVSITEMISGLIDEISGIASFPGAVIAAAAAAKGQSADWKIPKSPGTGDASGLSIGNIPGGIANDNIASQITGAPYASITSAPVAGNPKEVFDPAAWSKYLADRAEEGRLIQLAAGEQSAEREAIAESVQK
jgi:hypothetical protein